MSPDSASVEKDENSGANNDPTQERSPGTHTIESDAWPALAHDHPLALFVQHLPNILKNAEYQEVYGIQLDDHGSFHTKLILQKFLRANSNDLEKAEQQLLETLKWRKTFQPLKAKQEIYSKERFDGLGFVLVLQEVPGSDRSNEVVTFNLYGSVKDNKLTFGDLEGFLKWRVALMELGLERLDLGSAEKPIPDFGNGPDPYQAFQVHDYMNVSFIRQDPLVKTASKEAINVFQRYYPETLSRKLFVNVPVIMGWMFTATKVFLSTETVKKFTVLSYGEKLVTQLGPGIPKEYGGEGGALHEVGQTIGLQ